MRIIYIHSENRFSPDGADIVVCPCVTSEDRFNWEYYAKYIY